MLTGVLAALGAGLLWGLVFVIPLILGDYPGITLAVGRYLAFGVLALGLAWVDLPTLRRLQRADWIEAAKLALIGNLIYYTALASAIQLAGASVPTLLIGTLPVVIAVSANVLARRRGEAGGVPWRRVAGPLAVILAGILLVHSLPVDTAESGHLRSGRYLAGVALALLAVACWTWYPLRNSAWLRAHPNSLARVWATAQGLMTLPVALLALAAYAGWDLWSAAATPFAWPAGPRPVLYLSLMALTGLLASWLGTALWNVASHRLPAALSGQLIVFETLAALAYAFIWYQRWPSAAELAGITLLIVGVLLAVRAFRAPAR